MAQSVGYYQDDVTFSEGPFVICNPLLSGWRIEAQIVGSGTPVLPDRSIYDILSKSMYGTGKWNDRATAEAACDWLNRLVREGKIVTRLSGGWFVA